MDAATFYWDFRLEDIYFLLEASLKTIQISLVAIFAGTLLGILLGWALYQGNKAVQLFLNTVLDVFRSVPLIVQLILFDTFIAIAGYPLAAFWSGTIVLSVYTASLVASTVKGGIQSVPLPLRVAARSLGMSYWQDMRSIVVPLGTRAIFPSWLGIALSVFKDSALVSVIGYVELLRASQILITRTAEPFLVLGIAGLFYFTMSYIVSVMGSKLEGRWQAQ